MGEVRGEQCNGAGEIGRAGEGDLGGEKPEMAGEGAGRVEDGADGEKERMRRGGDEDSEYSYAWASGDPDILEVGGETELGEAERSLSALPQLLASGDKGRARGNTSVEWVSPSVVLRKFTWPRGEVEPSVGLLPLEAFRCGIGIGGLGHFACRGDSCASSRCPCGPAATVPARTRDGEEGAKWLNPVEGGATIFGWRLSVMVLVLSLEGLFTGTHELKEVLLTSSVSSVPFSMEGRRCAIQEEEGDLERGDLEALSRVDNEKLRAGEMGRGGPRRPHPPLLFDPPSAITLTTWYYGEKWRHHPFLK